MPGELSGVYRLVASTLYGGGLRLREGLRLRLRVHDRDPDRGQILVREGKGGKDRVTVLPSMLDEPLALHLAAERARYEAERAEGTAAVSLPGALARKYPNAETEWGWRYVNGVLSSVQAPPSAPEAVRRRLGGPRPGRICAGAKLVGYLLG